MSAKQDRHPAFMLVILVGGLIFGFGLGFSHMARPEVVLNFLTFVMGGAAITTGIVFAVATTVLDRAPLTGRPYSRRLKSFDKNVLTGGVIFGVGWGVTGICPGAAYASLGIGNVTILWAIAGMFIGSYLQAFWRARSSDTGSTAVASD
mgnify:CR=1 FL=1